MSDDPISNGLTLGVILVFTVLAALFFGILASCFLGSWADLYNKRLEIEANTKRVEIVMDGLKDIAGILKRD